MLPHHSYSVAKAKLTDSNLVSCGRKDVECVEEKQDIEPIGSLLILQFCLQYPLEMLDYNYTF